MFAKWMLTLGGPMDTFEKKHPFIAFLIMQFATAALLISAVTTAALAGGFVIWIFYKIVGVM